MESFSSILSLVNPSLSCPSVSADSGFALFSYLVQCKCGPETTTPEALGGLSFMCKEKLDYPLHAFPPKAE